MTDLDRALEKASMSELEQRARNAKALLAKAPDGPRSAEASLLLDRIDAEKARRSLPGNITSFLEAFPGGFKDPQYGRQERDDKLEASRVCRAALTQDAFGAALDGDPTPLLLDVKRLVGMTNLIQGSFEKPKLYDAIMDVRHGPSFVRELNLLLYGFGDAPERLEKFSDYMATLGLRKWTYGTYFLFLHDPKACMFVKPEGLKKALEITGYTGVEYDSAPTAAVYWQILGFANWIATHLKRDGRSALDPEDMIDVQSFIWHMAPTGKFARA